jgi:hypothetical protein
MEIYKMKIGDIFLIPFQNRYIMGKIMFISKRTKNVFSFILYKKIYDNKNINFDEMNEMISEIKLYTGLTKVFYTSLKIFEDKNWEIIGNKPLNEIENTNLQYHNIGGNLYKGDEYIRALTKEELELKIYPKMLIAGYDAIDIYLKIIYE